MSLEEKTQGEQSTIQQFVSTIIPLSHLKSLSKEIYTLLFHSAHHPEYGGDKLKKLQQIGLDLYNSIFPLPIKEKLASTTPQNLYLTIDDSLISIPWELLYDGEEFFCLRFNMGRMIYTSHPTVKSKPKDLQKIRMLILADPRNDLPKSYQEGNDRRVSPFPDYRNNCFSEPT